MIAIARAVDMKCKVLILDEPTSSLDDDEVAKLFKLMNRLKGEGVGIIFVTHFLEQVYEVCDRITVLRNGELVGEYEVKDLPRVMLVAKMMVEVLSQIMEFRNGESGLHVVHINTLTRLLLERLVENTDAYNLTPDDCYLISTASAFHDIGKVGIDESILNKPGKLTEEEFETMKEHTLIGASMLDKLEHYKDEKMEKEGYILGYQAQVNPEALGYHIKALINLEVSPEEKNVFYPFVRKCSNVIECNCVTGEYSMVLEVLFPSTTELDKFIGELQRFGRTKTLIVFSTSVEHRGINADIEETLE